MHPCLSGSDRLLGKMYESIRDELEADPSDQTSVRAYYGGVVQPSGIASTCIFCAAEFVAGKRGEDVVSDWYAKAIGRPSTSVVILGTVVRGTGSRSSTAPRPSQTVSAKEFRLSDVCPSCNNGWMSDIEHTAKPVLMPMMNGVGTILDPHEQRIVASWAQLKAITYDAIAGRQLPVGLAHMFFAARPVREVAVLLGCYDSPSNIDITLARVSGTLPEELAFRGQGPIPIVRVTLIFDHLILSIAHAVDSRIPVEFLATSPAMA